MVGGRPVAEHLDPRVDGRQRRAKLVRERREKLILEPIRLSKLGDEPRVLKSCADVRRDRDEEVNVVLAPLAQRTRPVRAYRADDSAQMRDGHDEKALELHPL